MTQPESGGAAAADAMAMRAAAVGRHPGWIMALGVVTTCVGVLILAWPGATVLVIAILTGLQLIVAGVFRLVAALAVGEGAASSRVLIALVGVLSVLAGILCLRSPFQTIAALGLILGLSFVLSGVVEVFQGLSGDSVSSGWTIVSGLFGLLAGIVVLTVPLSSLVVLTWVLGILLVVSGIVAVAAGAARRRTTTARPARHAGVPGARPG